MKILKKIISVIAIIVVLQDKLSIVQASENQEDNSSILLKSVKKRFQDEDIINISSIEDKPFFIIPFSSELSKITVGEKIFSYLSRAEKKIIISSDQITSLELANNLNKLCKDNSELDVEIIYGANIHNEFSKIIHSNPRIKCRKITLSDRETTPRMHNKFYLIDDIGTITGSPNATTKAFNNNIESFVFIYNFKVNDFYHKYYQYIIADENQQTNLSLSLREELNIFNGDLNNINLWFSPIIHISNSIRTALNRSETIDMNMFLIGRGTNPGNDVIDVIIQEALTGAKINMRLDMENLKYPTAKQAVEDIKKRKVAYEKIKKRFEVQFSAVELNDKDACFHDKLLSLIKKKNHEKWVIIGSAGLSTNVQDNLNQENMVLIKLPHIYDYFKQHFDKIPESPKIREIKDL